MPKGKRQSPTEIIREHGTPDEKSAFAAAIVGDNLEATSDILAGISKRLRALKQKVARRPGTKRIDRAVCKIVTKYGKEKIIASLDRLEKSGSEVDHQESHG
jgi:hypothetical protein